MYRNIKTDNITELDIVIAAIKLRRSQLRTELDIVIAAIKLRRSQLQANAALDYNKGDKVSFTGKRGRGTIYGEVYKVNTKSIKVVTDGDGTWNVGTFIPTWNVGTFTRHHFKSFTAYPTSYGGYEIYENDNKERTELNSTTGKYNAPLVAKIIGRRIIFTEARSWSDNDLMDIIQFKERL